MRKSFIACLVLVFVLFPAAVSAHPHSIDTPNNDQDQVIAHGQNHAPFDEGRSCDPDGLYGPAGYGLETAHHGPDAGTPGKGKNDRCYQIDGTSPGADINNPVITNP